MSHLSPPSTTEWAAVGALYAGLVDVAPELLRVSERDRTLMLRDLVCGAVEELRSHGLTFVRVAALVTRLAADAGMDDVRDSGMIDQLVAWCAQRFYAP